MAKISKKILAANSEIAREEADRQQRFTTLRDRAAEQQRAELYAGLGTSQQLSGQYTGAKPRDLSMYSQGLRLTGDYTGGYSSTFDELRRQGIAPTTYYRHQQGDSTTLSMGGPRYTFGSSGSREYITQEQTAEYLAAGPAENPLYKTQKNKETGALEWVDSDGDGTPDLKGGFTTMAERAAGGSASALNDIRSYEVAQQVGEVQDKFKASYDAAAAGDYDTADALREEALALVEQYGLNENFDSTGLRKDLRGLSFSIGDVYDPLMDTSGAAQSALGSEQGMLVGQVLHQSRQLMDPNSAETMRFKDALTSGAVAAVDASRDNAIRALGSQERGAARSMRDMALQSGRASNTVAMAATAARASERFATLRASVEGDVAAQKAQIYGEAAKLYESFRLDLANNATQLASAWVNDQSGVRDAFRALHANLAMNYVNNLYAFAGGSQAQGVQLQIAKDSQDSSSSGGGWTGALTGAVSGAGAGAALGPWGALAGGVVGGALGAIE